MNKLKSLMLKPLLLLLFTLTMAFPAVADEGMWLLMLLDKNYQEMKELGLRLTPEDIYSVNNASLKDAVVSLQFCTAEIVSPEGLMLTNHHCAYGAIQSHSSAENNYLDDGFWAANRGAELPTDITASILIRMEDVTDQVFSALNADMDAEIRSATINRQKQEIISTAIEGTHYDAEVATMFEGNQYILFIYETFTDVRLVGAPPSSIGKFGGDADNWEWPRQTGDFSLIRIYASPDNTPADYSEENVPYRPRHFFPVSLKGYDLNDYAMVMGFPGSTQRYLTSYGIELAQNVSNPTRIDLREERLALMKEVMDVNEEVRVQYASKYSQISNYYKYFIGQNEGLARLGTIDQKREQERQFEQWVNADPDRRARYGDVLQTIEDSYNQQESTEVYWQYLIEGIFGVEVLNQALGYRGLEAALEESPEDAETIEQMANRMKARAESFFPDYYAPIDKAILATVMEMYVENVPEAQQPEVIRDLNKKYKGKWAKYADRVFKKSFLVSQEETMEFLNDPDLKTLQKDPAFSLAKAMLTQYQTSMMPALRQATVAESEAMQTYVAGLMEMNGDQLFYPDANSTLRLTYGSVKGYYPRDGVYYKHYTTMEGIMDKEDPNDDEFIVPEKLKQLYQTKDYGRYAAEDGQMYVNFITNNDITGGNSGSPVLDADGHLIGVAFDGNWEAMTGDLVFDEELKRCINVDIRYVLFIIDKFAGAGHLVEEMTLVE